MTVSKSRDAARRGAHKRKYFGHKLINLQVGANKSSFIVHEDLICAYSNVFKERLQSSRKAVEGDCSICSEEVAGFEPVSFCKSCGQNLHTKCIDQWLQQQQTCPMCRVAWPQPQGAKENTVEDVSLTNINPAHFDRYVQWMYSGVLPPCYMGDEEARPRFARLMGGLLLGQSMQDKILQLAVRREVIEHCKTTRSRINGEMVRDFYSMTTPGSDLRSFLVELCALGAKSVELTCDLPAQFVLDLAQRLLLRQQVDEAKMREDLAKYLIEEEERVLQT